MLFTRTPIYGIDIPIDGYQKWLYKKLIDTWGLTDAINSKQAYNCYSRAYRNQTVDGYIPEIYVANGEYSKDVFLDDRVKALSFFVVGETIPFSTGMLQANVSILFFLNLDKIVPGADRQDEKVRQQVIQLVQGIKYFGFQFLSVETGVDTVLREFNGFRSKEGMKYRDMHPYHCFRLNFRVSYKSNC